MVFWHLAGVAAERPRKRLRTEKGVLRITSSRLSTQLRSAAATTPLSTRTDLGARPPLTKR